MQPADDASMPRTDADNRDPKISLTENRTFLAWVRTRIVLVGLGFVVAQFCPFLRELKAMQGRSPMEATACSTVLGTALMVGGVLVTTLASFQDMRPIRDLEHGVQTASPPSRLYYNPPQPWPWLSILGPRRRLSTFNVRSDKKIKAIE
jgi:uncharacterized membrane protein YidH (DUF202 family)